MVGILREVLGRRSERKYPQKKPLPGKPSLTRKPPDSQKAALLIFLCTDTAHLRPQRLELGPARDLLLPQDQTLQREQEQTHDCTATQAV